MYVITPGRYWYVLYVLHAAVAVVVLCCMCNKHTLSHPRDKTVASTKPIFSEDSPSSRGLWLVVTTHPPPLTTHPGDASERGKPAHATKPHKYLYGFVRTRYTHKVLKPRAENVNKKIGVPVGLVYSHPANQRSAHPVIGKFGR